MPRPTKFDTPHFADALRGLRHARRLTQAELARKIGITVSHLSRLETGAIHPYLGIAAALAAALRVPVGRLLKKPPAFGDSA